MILLSFVSQTYFLVNEENNNKLQTENRNPRAKRCQTNMLLAKTSSLPKTRPQRGDALLQKLPGRRCTGHSCSEPTWAPAGPSLQYPQPAPQSQC